jgi:hypothetical protein
MLGQLEHSYRASRPSQLVISTLFTLSVSLPLAAQAAAAFFLSSLSFHLEFASMPWTAVMIASEMPAAIRPYSIAVAIVFLPSKQI